MSTQKHFVNLFFGLGLNVILGMLTTPIITRMVDPIDYGNLSLFMTLGNIFILVGMMGRDQSYTRFFYVNEDNEYKRYILVVTCSIPIAISIVCGLIIIFYYLFVDYCTTAVLPIFSVYIVALTVGVFSNLTVRLKLKTTLYSLLINIQKLLYVVLTIALVKGTDIDHLVILTGSTVFAQVIVCVVAIISERKTWSPRRIEVRLKEQYCALVSPREVAKYGFPFIFANLCNWIFTGADKIMIKMFTTDTELGIYASAVSVIGIFSIVTTTFSTIWGPLAVEEFERNNPNRDFFIKASDYVCIILFAMGGCVVVGKDIIVYLLGAKYRDAVFLIPFLSLHPIMYTLSESTAYGINFAKRTEYHIVVSAISCVVNVILNIALIPVIGPLGAAISTGLAYTMFFILRTYFSVKCYKVNYSIKKIAVMVTMYYILVIYNSFNRFDLLSVGMFVVCFIITLLIYKKRMQELIGLFFDYLKSILKVKKDS